MNICARQVYSYRCLTITMLCNMFRIKIHRNKSKNTND